MSAEPGASNMRGERRTVLEAQDVHAFYGKSHILHGVSLHLDEGEIVTVLGRNGAGKTTTMRSLMGLTAVREGSVHMRGQDTTRWPAYRIARLEHGFRRRHAAHRLPLPLEHIDRSPRIKPSRPDTRHAPARSPRCRPPILRRARAPGRAR